MRKNSLYKKAIAKYVYVRYKVEGVNPNLLINKLSKNGVFVYKVKRVSPKIMLLTIPSKDTEKFFAITGELCYNVKKIKLGGRFFPVIKFFSSVGIVAGIVFFLLFSVFSSDLIFKITYQGDGAEYYSAVNKYLNQSGIKKYSRFSQIDLNALSSSLVLNVPDISFAECTRRGGELKIYLVSSKLGPPLVESDTPLVSTVNGIIVDLKVYRGKPLKSIGDTVKVGDVLVDRSIDLQGNELSGVLAFVKISVEEKFEYFSLQDNKEEVAIVLAKESSKEKEGLLEPLIVLKTPTDKGFLYVVTLKYYKIIKSL